MKLLCLFDGVDPKLLFLSHNAQHFFSRTDFVSGNGQSSEKQILTIYDLDNKFIAYTAAFDDIVDVLAEWGSLYVLSSDRKISILQEKDTQTKLEVLVLQYACGMQANRNDEQNVIISTSTSIWGLHCRS